MERHWSKHNLLSKIEDSDRFLLVNLLRGEADLLTPEKAAPLLAGTAPEDPEFQERGYWVDPAEEEAFFRARYLDFLDAREKEEIQIFFVPWYACNFSCSYCFQDEYDPATPDLSAARMDAFFDYVVETFAGRPKYLTLFGGEPLLPGAAHRAYIERFLEQAERRGLPVAIVTNGFHLAEYRDILRKGNIREIQVTLDGTEAVHDSRRHLKGKGPTFSAIVQGIDSALADDHPINLRMVVDKTNLGELVGLARLAKERGWTGHPRFKTQLGRNYELHHCQAAPSDLFERAALYEAIYRMAREHPEILEFHRPAFSVVKFLKQEGKLPDPLFDACPGAKSEWAFDSMGRIFACTATVGKRDEILGTYHPFVNLDQTLVSQWVSRDITSIRECGACASRLACGGGCASVAKNRHGKFLAPDCRPVPRLLSLGAGLYFREEAAHG
ncbi:MAG: radical SAM protein [Spirochaetes bacterium]|nr:radical SAM protein [Spirochaetota bacterium]